MAGLGAEMVWSVDEKMTSRRDRIYILVGQILYKFPARKLRSCARWVTGRDLLSAYFTEAPSSFVIRNVSGLHRRSDQLEFLKNLKAS